MVRHHYIHHVGPVGRFMRRLLTQDRNNGRPLVMNARAEHPEPEAPPFLSRYKGYWYRKLNAQKASRLVELFRICHCSVCHDPLERDHIRILAGAGELSANGIAPSDQMQFEHAHLVWVEEVPHPIIFCNRDYKAWLDPASRETRDAL